MTIRLSAKRQSNHKKRRTRRVLTLGTVGALAFGASVAEMAQAAGPLSAPADGCSTGIVFTQSDTPAAAGDNPRHVVTGDLDGDGNAAVVAADNDADGALAEVTGLTADGAYEAAAADLTSDGTQDLVVASSADDQVDVFTGSCG